MAFARFVHPLRVGLLAEPRENKHANPGRGGVLQKYEDGSNARSHKGQRAMAMDMLNDRTQTDPEGRTFMDAEDAKLFVKQGWTSDADGRNNRVAEFVNRLRPLMSYKEKVNNFDHAKDFGTCKYGQFFDEPTGRWRCIKNLDHHMNAGARGGQVDGNYGPHDDHPGDDNDDHPGHNYEPPDHEEHEAAAERAPSPPRRRRREARAASPIRRTLRSQVPRTRSGRSRRYSMSK